MTLTCSIILILQRGGVLELMELSDQGNKTCHTPRLGKSDLEELYPSPILAMPRTKKRKLQGERQQQDRVPNPKPGSLMQTQGRITTKMS